MPLAIFFFVVDIRTFVLYNDTRSIEVRVVAESYTSGTSYLDGERPEKRYYDRSRRVHRGQFHSNTGMIINADVNAAYQIMKAGGIEDLVVKVKEPVKRIKVA